MRSKPIRPHSTHPSFHTSLSLFILLVLSLSLYSLSLPPTLLPWSLLIFARAMKNEMGSIPRWGSASKRATETESDPAGQALTSYPSGQSNQMGNRRRGARLADQPSSQKLACQRLSHPPRSHRCSLYLCLSLSTRSLNVHLASVSFSDGPGGGGQTSSLGLKQRGGWRQACLQAGGKVGKHPARDPASQRRTTPSS